MFRKGLKARPHDMAAVIELKPELVEIHASAEDLDKNIEGAFPNLPLVVHFPEYEGQELLDPASLDERKRVRAVAFYKKALDTTRRWGAQFKGTPKAIIHPGGQTIEPVNRLEKAAMYDAFAASWRELNSTGVDFLVENMPPQPWFYGGQWHCNIFLDPRECLDQCTGNGYGFCLDVCHAQLWCNWMGGEANLGAYMRKVRPVTAHVHISDAKGVDGEGIQINEGMMNFKEIFDTLGHLQIGFVPEVWLGHKDGMAGFKTAWERLAPFYGRINGNGTGQQA